MTLKSYLWGMRISLVLSLAAWGVVVYYIDPQHCGIVGYLLFYSTLFLFLSALFILIFVPLKKAAQSEVSGGQLSASFRQGIIVSLLAILLLFLQSFRALTWWDGLLALAGALLVELYFLSR